MAWAKFSDKMIRNRKVRRAARQDPAAVLLWIFAIVYCCEQMTDGEIEGEELRDLLPGFRDKHLQNAIQQNLIHDKPGCESSNCLGSQGLPLPGSDMFIVHDFAETQMQVSEWQAMSSGALLGNHNRWHVEKGIKKTGCRLCFPPKSGGES